MIAFEDTPVALRRALSVRVGEIAPPGANFDVTDIVSTDHPISSRLIFVWNFGRRWVVATEHGGIAYSDPIFGNDVSHDGQSAVFVQKIDAQPQSVCSTAARLIRSELKP